MDPRVGLTAAIAGLRTAFSSREVRGDYLRMVLAYVVTTLALEIGGIWGVWMWTHADGVDGLWGVALFLARWLGIAGVIVGAPYFALLLVNVAFSQLAERLFFHGMRALAPERAQELTAREGLAFAVGVGVSVRRMLRFVAAAIALFAWSLVPVLGTVTGPILAVYFGARGLAWDLLDPYFDKRGLDYRQQLAFVRAHQHVLRGFGLPMMLVLAVPMVGPLLAGFIQAAVAALAVELDRDDPSLAQPLGARPSP